jgi:manganese/zinc/iron transport system ATP- binding protein
MIDAAAPSIPARTLACEGLGVHFDRRSALENVDAVFTAGQITSLLGPNGAGKSTLLKVIAGLLSPSHGRVAFGGVTIAKPNPAIVYVPQRSSVDWTFPVNVLDVVLMAIAKRRTRWLPFGGSDRDAALNALDQVGMAAFATVQIGQLSGGQQQRVFLARALLQQGEAVLLDEPFAGVDTPTQELLISLFRGLANRGSTIICATHDLAQASEFSDQILLLNRTVIAHGSPAETMTSANLRATFGGQAVLPIDEIQTASGAHGL